MHLLIYADVLVRFLPLRIALGYQRPQGKQEEGAVGAVRVVSENSQFPVESLKVLKNENRLWDVLKTGGISERSQTLKQSAPFSYKPF
jgi:hypothetical protein